METRNGIPPFCPILSAIGTPNHKITKFLLKLVTPSAANEYNVIDSFHLAEKICQQHSKLHMASLDVDLYLRIFP